MPFPGSTGSCWAADTWAADTWVDDAWAAAGEPGGDDADTLMRHKAASLPGLGRFILWAASTAASAIAESLA